MVNNLKELKDLLKNRMTIPGTYHHFEEGEGPGLPFYVYYDDEKESFDADNQTYAKIHLYCIELYTKRKEMALEKQIEDILKEADLPFSQRPYYLDDEKCYMQLYSFQVLEG